MHTICFLPALLGGLLAGATAWAQAPTWQAALGPAGPVAPAVAGSSGSYATAVDPGTGAVYVVGGFSGQLVFGSTTLRSAGGADVFVARWNPSANAWAWAVRGGGTLNDAAHHVAVRGGAVYVAGTTTNYAVSADADGAHDVRLGTRPLPGTGLRANDDAFVARLTDPGTGAAPADWDWALSGGGPDDDVALAVAVNGPAVYVSGYVYNSGISAAHFGAHLLPVAAANRDAFVARLSDPGTGTPPADWDWALAGGGIGADMATAMAVNGPIVYVSGTTRNYAVGADADGGYDVRFGTHPLPGTGPNDNSNAFVARFTDPGAGAPPADWDWAVQGGGISEDRACGMAVRGNAVYVVGDAINLAVSGDADGFSNVRFGPHPLPGFVSRFVNRDIFLARLSDPGTGPASWDWALQGGSTTDDFGLGVAVSGTELYVAGSVQNDKPSSVRFGTRTLPGTTSQQVALVAHLTDPGMGVSPSDWDWALSGSSSGSNGVANGLAVQGTTAYVSGAVHGVATFGRYAVANPSTGLVAFVAAISPTVLVATRPMAPATGAGLLLYPSPSSSVTTLTGAAPGSVVLVLDAQGRCVLRTTADAAGTVRLVPPPSLPAGVYVVRAGTLAARLLRE